MKALIAIVRHFYGPESTVELLKSEHDGGNTPRVFQSPEEAQKWCREKNAEIYHLRHNESCRPDFVVITVNDMDGEEARSLYNEGAYDDLLSHRGTMLSA
jgi:hypothetical protein